MRQGRDYVQGQLQDALSRLMGERAWRAVNRDGDEVKSGRMFHVEDSERRLEFGSDPARCWPRLFGASHALSSSCARVRPPSTPFATRDSPACLWAACGLAPASTGTLANSQRPRTGHL